RKIRWVGAPLVAYVLASYAVLLGPLHLVYVRYGSPIVPPLAAAGGALAVQIVDRWGARSAPRRAAVTASLAILALAPPAVRLARGSVTGAILPLPPPAVRIARFDRLLARADTRDLARDWLVSHGEGTTVLTEGAYGHVQAVEAPHARMCRQELPAALWQPTP